MADNVTLNPGAGGSVVAADDISGVQYQRVKLIHGADGANDGDVAITNPFPVKERRPSTATVTSVNDTSSSTTLLSSNTNRLGASVYNDSTVALYIKHGTTASSSDFTVKLNPAEFYELPFPCYTGRIDGIWASDASGAARITEHT